ncbi:hypothetical protein MLD38_002847 [Melastoma candidum]|uniref:Uncharacterized protein n=1 Tax=Melastoma candidum TaxID=119954 RepID=A0ACB9S052_9MYRT|nr:hypothetical protein MLD38_002847 [Melastoma candidum]
MLPSSIRSSLRARLKGVVFNTSYETLASEWRDDLGRMLGWPCPLAQDIVKWQSKGRGFEQNSSQKSTFLRQADDVFSEGEDRSRHNGAVGRVELLMEVREGNDY